MAPKPQPSWYADGLRFECVPDCGACCTRHDDYAYVYLEEVDVGRISRLLEISRRDFLNRYTIVDDDDRVLKMDEADCPFLAGTRCGIYEARPVQCRTFPFWSETLASRRNWNRLKAFCPGIDRGPRRSLATIQGHLRERDGESP